jgi:hypothetical protein
MMQMNKWMSLLVLCAITSAQAQVDWFDSLLEQKQTQNTQVEKVQAVPLPDFGRGSFTVAAWVRTQKDGTIVAKTRTKSAWTSGGKSLFIRGGRVTYDIGWVGALRGKSSVTDGKWHHIVLTGSKTQKIYVDGRLEGSSTLEQKRDPRGSALMIGYTSRNFPGDGETFQGDIDDLRIYGRVLRSAAIRSLYERQRPTEDGDPVAYYPFDGTILDASGGHNQPREVKRSSFSSGRVGKALSLSKGAYLVIPSADSDDHNAALWAKLKAKHQDEDAIQEMDWVREDGIWSTDWRRVSYARAAQRYASLTQRPSTLAREIKTKASAVKGPKDIKAVHALYIKARRYEQLLAQVEEYKLKELRIMIQELCPTPAQARRLVARLDKIEAQAAAWTQGPPKQRAFKRWEKAVEALRQQVVVTDNALLDFDEIVFVRRYTYNSNHYYTEFINSTWKPGGNLCILSLKAGAVRELVPQLKNGVFERFDLSFDAKKVVFAWKCAPQEGYRIYEVNIDGTGLRQLTFPPKDEKDIQKRYRVFDHYHHGTDDMHPCYLPDGGITFISTRCQYGILCDAPDDFTTTVLYRMDADGRNMQKLSNSSVSEASPAVLPDGRIMYTRWEYVDKGAVSVKCLWAIKPDGSASQEIYANDISLPPTFIYGRAIPQSVNKYVVMGTPHCPQNGVGTVIRLDMNKPIRTRDPMTYLTPYVDIRAEPGFSFRECRTGPDQQVEFGDWKHDGSGRGPLFKDPYPLSERYFLVAHKPTGPQWHDAKGYGLYLLDERGNVQLIHRDPEMSCWLPYPLKARPLPDVPRMTVDKTLAARNQAKCIVTDIYHGLEDVEPGSIKYIRVLEQIPRPWASRRQRLEGDQYQPWGGDQYDQQHVVITKDTHLGLKVQHGVVPVEEDGSAHFIVPAKANIFFQVLDKDYMSVQTERTFVNYMPGETRSCIGCHETPEDAAPAANTKSVVLAVQRAPSLPGPQPGETSGQRPLDYYTDVQPVLDKHCVDCHSGDKPEGDMNLSGELTALFNVSYEKLIPERRGGQGRKRGLYDLVGPTIGENHPKTGNVHYLPARSLGSYNSVLVSILTKGQILPQDSELVERAKELTKVHKDLKLTLPERIRITNWVDTNGQYYGSYWGRRNLRYKDHPNFRPKPTFADAISMVSPIPEGER